MSSVGGSLVPRVAEKTTVFEGALMSHMFVATNAFDITIKDPIVYDDNPTTAVTRRCLGPGASSCSGSPTSTG